MIVGRCTCVLTNVLFSPIFYALFILPLFCTKQKPSGLFLSTLFINLYYFWEPFAYNPHVFEIKIMIWNWDLNILGLSDTVSTVYVGKVTWKSSKLLMIVLCGPLVQQRYIPQLEHPVIINIGTNTEISWYNHLSTYLLYIIMPSERNRLFAQRRSKVQS